MFTNGQHICQHLCRMVFIGQTVPYRNTCMRCQFFNDFLTKSSVLDSFIHSSKNSCCVCNAFFLADLGSCRIQISSSHTQVMSSYFKRTTGSGTCFFKNKSYIFTFVVLMKLSCFFLCFQVCCQIDHVSNLFWCKVFQCKKITSF